MSQSSGESPQTEIGDFAEEIAESRRAAQATAMWGFDFSNLWPTEVLKNCGLEKIERFVHHRLDA